MRFTRSHFGIITTVLWLVLICIAVRDPARLLAMELNELGDFLAGVFAPLAFLWLVLGYLQQGEELQHSTKALKLQAEELRNSVNQQREMVEVTRQQLDNDREAAALEQRKQAEAAKPLFVFTTRSGSLAAPESLLNIDMENKGSKVTNVFGFIQGQQSGIIDVQIFESSKTVRIRKPHSIFPNGQSLRITYYDAFNNERSCRYLIHKEHHNFPSFELVEE